MAQLFRSKVRRRRGVAFGEQDDMRGFLKHGGHAPHMLRRVVDEHLSQIVLLLLGPIREYAGRIRGGEFLRLVGRINFRLNLLTNIV